MDEKKLFTFPEPPKPLCFDKTEFDKDDFNVDEFMAGCCRGTVELEEFRTDLSIYLKTLKTAMIELINEDYADFVSLSTNLVGMDKAIDKLSIPLGQLKEEVMNVQNLVEMNINNLESKINRKKEIRDKKLTLRRLIDINESVGKMEKILKLQPEKGDSLLHVGLVSVSEDHIVERVSSEFNILQCNVAQCKGLRLVEQLSPRIEIITTTLQHNLEKMFVDSLNNNDINKLRACLRTYTAIDKVTDAHQMFRKTSVKPYMDEVITEAYIVSNKDGLVGMYSRILEFVPKHCKLVRSATMGDLLGGNSDIVRGYDFIVYSVWPEIVTAIESRTPNIFAPGNPETFHQRFVNSMNFLDKFELQCSTQASVKCLRQQSPYQTFINKWSLPIYYQIRFQEIASALELSFDTPFNLVQDEGGEFLLKTTHTLWWGLNRCWAADVFLIELIHKFWKLSLQLLSRFATWVSHIQQTELEGATVESGAEVSTLTPDCTDPPSQTVGENVDTPTNNTTTTPITITQLVNLTADSQTLIYKLERFFYDKIKPRLSETGVSISDINTYLDCFMESRQPISEIFGAVEMYIKSDICSQCVLNLKTANDIPRLYRRTNRDPPTKPSAYVNNAVKPLSLFVDEHRDTLDDVIYVKIITTIVEELINKYHIIINDILTSVKKMEDSLKRLKKTKKSNSSGVSVSGKSDDDKIRLQLLIDVQAFGDQFVKFGLISADIVGYCELEELVNAAINNT